MYRTIDASFWTDPDIRTLSGTERYLFLYFVSNPHAHVSGIYYLPRVMIEHETGLKGKALEKGIETLSKRFFVWYDPPNEVVFVRSMFRYQGRGKNHDQSAAKQLNNLHKSSLVSKFLSIYPEISELLDKNKGVRRGIEGGSKGVLSFPLRNRNRNRRGNKRKKKGPLRDPKKKGGYRRSTAPLRHLTVTDALSQTALTNSGGSTREKSASRPHERRGRSADRGRNSQKPSSRPSRRRWARGIFRATMANSTSPTPQRG